jgi:glycosyltransferase involved in cell wall biosynthesis
MNAHAKHERSPVGHLVDVIIPTRNRPRLTADAIESVRRQSFAGWRLLVVDDGSDVPARSALRRRFGDDPRVCFLQRTDGGGPQAARQTGLEVSSAPFVATLDSDDVWATCKLEKQVAAMKSPAPWRVPDLVLCGHEWLRKDGHRTGDVRVPIGGNEVNPLVSTNMSTLLVRREALLTAGGFLPPATRSLRTCEGVEFYIRLTRHCSVVVVPELLVSCRHHSGERANDSLPSRIQAEEMEYVLALHHERLSSYPADLARLRARTSARYLEGGFTRDGLRYLRLAASCGRVAQRAGVLRKYGPSAIRAMFTARQRRMGVSSPVA